MRLTISRRQFIGSSAAATGLGAVPHAYAAGSDVLRVGLIGCGGRGTGAASQALRADPAVKLVAMGDAFEDRLGQSLDTLTKDEEIAAKIDVPPGRRFVGFDAYKQVIASGVDVVLLCTPPHFRPIHLEGRGRGRQTRLRREARRRRRARRPLRPGHLRAGEGEGPVGRLRPGHALR